MTGAAEVCVFMRPAVVLGLPLAKTLRDQLGRWSRKWVGSFSLSHSVTLRTYAGQQRFLC